MNCHADLFVVEIRKSYHRVTTGVLMGGNAMNHPMYVFGVPFIVLLNTKDLWGIELKDAGHHIWLELI